MNGLDNCIAPVVPSGSHARNYTFLTGKLELWPWYLEGPSLAPSLLI